MGEEFLQVAETAEATATTVDNSNNGSTSIKRPIGEAAPEAEPQIGQVQVIVVTGTPADLAVLTKFNSSIGKGQEEEEETTEEEETEEDVNTCAIRETHIQEISIY